MASRLSFIDDLSISSSTSRIQVGSICIGFRSNGFCFSTNPPTKCICPKWSLFLESIKVPTYWMRILHSCLDGCSTFIKVKVHIPFCINEIIWHLDFFLSNIYALRFDVFMPIHNVHDRMMHILVQILQYFIFNMCLLWYMNSMFI